VLLSGESGTGKEVIASSIHSRSPRRDHPFVAVNCGAISADLIESELFGHVKGRLQAPTAIDQDLEAANKGTIFLDEITETNPGIPSKNTKVAAAKAKFAQWVPMKLNEWMCELLPRATATLKMR